MLTHGYCHDFALSILICEAVNKKKMVTIHIVKITIISLYQFKLHNTRQFHLAYKLLPQFGGC